jgi:DnaK suppressor protein
MRTTLDVESIRTQLEEKRAVLWSRIRVKQQKQSGVDEPLNPDRSDLAQDYFLQERQSALAERLEDTLAQVETALAKLDEGTYGQCEHCGQKISTARLTALPYATLCIDCQAQSQNKK